MVKKITSTFILYCLLINLYAQKQGQSRIDSLQAQLPKISQDSNKANSLNDLSYTYSSIAPDEGIKYGQQALSITEKLKSEKGIADANIVIGINYFNKADYKEAMEYYNKALKIAEELNYKFEIAEIMERFGIIYREQSKYTAALEYDLKALKMDEELNNRNGKANVLWDMGNISGEQTFYSKAFEYLDSALKIYLELDNKEGEGSALNDIGYMYFLVKDYSKALEYFNRALDINEKFGYTRGIATNLISKGICYGDQGDYITAIEYEQKAFKIAEEPGYKRDIIFSVGNIGEYYLDIAKDTTGKILPDSLQSKSAVIRTSTIYLKRAIAIAKETELLNAFQYFSLDLSEAQSLSGNYKDALESYKQHSTVYDSIFSLEINSKIASLEAKRETDIKQREIEILNKDKKLQESEIKRQTLIRNSILGAIGLATIFSFLLMRSYNRRKKAAFDKELVLDHNRLIQKQKIELEKEVTERTAELKQSLEDLKSTQKQLIQSEKMASLGELTAGIAHEIQNPLNFVNNFSELNTELIDEMNVELQSGNRQEALIAAKDIKENNLKIMQHGKRAEGIVKSMLQHSRISTGGKEIADINILIDEYLRLSYHGIHAKETFFNVTIEKDFDENIGKINIVIQDFSRVLVNLFNNAFYSLTQKKSQHPEGYEPTLSVSTKKLADKIEIHIRDNGVGIPQKVLDKIFQPFFTTKPTGQGTGLGLSLSYDIIKAQGGELKVESKEGVYAEFIIQLPIKETI